MSLSHEHMAPSAMVADDLKPPRVPQQARSREKHDRLLDAAFALFGEHGYEGTTIDAIAAQAGVSVGVFYSYFRSKRQILMTLVHQHNEQGISLLIGKGIAVAPAKIDNIEKTLWAFFRITRENSGFRRAQLELALSDPVFAEFVRGRRETLRAALRGELERGRAAGVLRADLECDGTTTAIFALTTQLRDQLMGQSDAVAARPIKAAARMIYHALVPDIPIPPSPDEE